jgi:putative oxidoreductase
MSQKWRFSFSSRPTVGLDIVRITVALVLSVHSIVRIIGGHVSGFGRSLGSYGLPLGIGLAWLITLSTLTASVALVVRRYVVPACICHMIVLITGIFLNHIHDGWFVVGSGRNGMEYSVVLIACLTGVLWSYWPKKS